MTTAFKSYLLEGIQAGGGWVNSHAHFDRAFTATPAMLDEAHARMEEKWTLIDAMKRGSSEEDYFNRIEKATLAMIGQGVRAAATFIDIDPITELRAIKAAFAVKEKYKEKIDLLLINQVIKGVLDSGAQSWAHKGLEYVDIIGGLPSKDRPNHEKHLDTILSWAKETGKMLHVHIDQENNPEERDTELLARKTMEYGLEGKVVVVHAISVGAHPLGYRQDVYRLMKDAGMSVVCSPSAALSMKPVEGLTHIHNSIAPVPELLDAGIPVALGTDNITDIYQPLVDGDMYTELRILAEACRFYDLDALIRIATVNGRAALGLS